MASSSDCKTYLEHNFENDTIYVQLLCHISRNKQTGRQCDCYQASALHVGSLKLMETLR